MCSKRVLQFLTQFPLDLDIFTMFSGHYNLYVKLGVTHPCTLSKPARLVSQSVKRVALFVERVAYYSTENYVILVVPSVHCHEIVFNQTASK